MHALTRVLTKAGDKESAVSNATGAIERLITKGYIDYGITLRDNDELTARLRAFLDPYKEDHGEIPIAVRTDTELGQKLIEKAWEQEMKRRRNDLKKIKETLEKEDEETILKNPPFLFSAKTHLLYHNKWLIDEHGQTFKQRKRLDEWLKSETHAEFQEKYVVPVDTHF